MVFNFEGPLLLLTQGIRRLIVAILLLILFFYLFRWMMGQRQALFGMTVGHVLDLFNLGGMLSPANPIVISRSPGYTQPYWR
jgi:hypothetical protein